MAQMDESGSASEILACLRQQTLALQHLAALNDFRIVARNEMDIVDPVNTVKVEKHAEHPEYSAPHKTLQIVSGAQMMSSRPETERDRAMDLAAAMNGITRTSPADKQTHLPGRADTPKSPPRTGLASTGASSEWNVDVANRPASAIDHTWDRQLAKQPMEVECNVIILSLEGVDTANHCFSANIVAEFRVLYPGDVHTFDPKIRCTNLKESTMEPVMSQCKCPDGSYLFKRQWHGVFVEHLELRNFPMDIQDLSFEFVSDWPADKVKLTKCWKRESQLLKDDVTRDVWEKTTIRETKGHSRVAIRVVEDEFAIECSGMDDEVVYPRITFALQVRRHASNYMFNIIIPTAVLVSLAFCSFTVPVNEVADRASITLTLLLSIIAYKLIIKDELPKVNFLTLIDFYILTCMAIVAMISFANSFVGHGVENVTDKIRWMDYECRAVLGTIWAVSNFGFGLRVVWRQVHAKRRMSTFRKQCGDNKKKVK